MGSAITLLASQVLAFTAPSVNAAVAQCARISAIATVQILHAETTREEAGPLALKRQRRIGAGGRVSLEFE